MCCHPALAPDVASALALRLVVGVPTADIARLFLVPEPTMAARLTRGKRKIVTAGIPFGGARRRRRCPSGSSVVAQVAYLAFTAGYAPGSGPDLLRADLSGEAVRLVRVTLALRPDEPVLQALLALLLLQHSRRDARVDADGRLVLLPDQDRSRWHLDEVAEALDLLERMPADGHLAARRELPAAGLRGGRARDGGHGIRHPVGPRSASTTTALVALNPSPAVRLAAAVALAERDGPARRAALPSTSSTTRCRTATGCPRCAASCSPGPASTRPPSRPSTSRSPGAATTSSATTSRAAATSSRRVESRRTRRLGSAGTACSLLSTSRHRQAQQPDGADGEQRPPPVHPVGADDALARP